MKRTKLMVGVLALSASLLGTGYAAFKDQVKIGGAVSTAEFCVQFGEDVKLDITEQNKDEYEIDDISATGVDNHSISFNVSNLKPGVPIVGTTTIRNISTIDAMFKGASVTSTGGEYDPTKVSLEVVMGEGNNKVTYTGNLSSISTEDDLNKANLADVKDIAGVQEIPVEFTVELTAEDQAHTEQKGIDFDLKFDWEQK